MSSEIEPVANGVIYTVVGHPGSGKTTYLTRNIGNAVKQHGSNSVMVASFTRSAAVEIANKVQTERVALPRANVTTLHGHAYRALGRPEIADVHISEWNAERPLLAVTDAKTDPESVVDLPSGTTDGDLLYGEYQILRHKMVDRDVWPERVLYFAKRWEDWKKTNSYIDFTDMIEMAYDMVDYPPGDPQIGVFDEFQDFTPLECALVEKWSHHMQSVVIAGDPNQCHPPYSRVLTTGGYVRVDELDPSKHRLVSYDKKGGSEIRRKGYEFEISRRPYDGDMIELENMDCTPNHRLVARWSEIARGSHVVYLMRKGLWWRVGRVPVLYNQRGVTQDAELFGPSMRARHEGADAVWILDILPTEREAAIMESRVQLLYRLPSMLFHNDGLRRGLLSTDDIVSFYDDVKQYGDPVSCLSDHGRELEYPFWKKDMEGKGVGGKAHFAVQACNYIPYYMEVPYDVGSNKPAWGCPDMTVSEYHGDVYSIEVKPYHTYVCENQIVHNSIYNFKGASPEYLLGRAKHTDLLRTLPRSYRVPKVVQQYSRAWIQNASEFIDPIYLPRDEEGWVRRSYHGFYDADRIVEDIQRKHSDKSVMIMASCAYMIDPFKSNMRANGITFHNPYRRSRADWNPLTPSHGTAGADRVMAFMRRSSEIFGDNARDWTWSEVALFTHVLGARGVVKHGKKKWIDQNKESKITISYDEMLDLFEEDALPHLLSCDVPWFRDRMLAQHKDRYAYVFRVMDRGVENLRSTPKIMIGTIHSFKGGEADVVYVLPDLSREGMNAWDRDDESRDSIYRLFYVAFTRAKEGVVLCSPSTKNHVDLPRP